MIRYVQTGGSAEVVCDVLAVSMPREAISPTRFMRQVLLDPNFRAEGSILALDDDQPVGYGLAVARQVPTEGEILDPDKGYLWLLGVHPTHQNRGIGSELLSRMEDYLRAQSRKLAVASCYSPGYFQPGVDVDAYPKGVRFLKQKGYEQTAEAIAMETSLWDLSIPEWIATKSTSIHLTRDFRSLISPLLEFAKKTFGPDWVRFARESMLRQLEGDQRTGLAIAIDQGEIVGFAHHDAERFGPIGVSPSARGRGIGHLLLWDILAQQRERGYRTSWFLWSDAKTAARLYDQAGFKTVRTMSILQKLL